MTSASSSRTEDVASAASPSDVERVTEDTSSKLSNEANAVRDFDSLKLACEMRKLLADAEASLVNKGVLGNPQIVDRTSGKQTPEAKTESKQKPSVQNRETIEKTADELYRAIHKGIYLHASSRSDKVSRLIESLSSEDRKALESVYNEKYGSKDKPDALKADLKENFTELRFRRAEATLNRESDRTNDAGALMAALAYANENSEKGSAQLRAVFSTLNSNEIQQLSADFKRHYGKTYQDALGENKNISKATLDVISILEKGVDRRTTYDIYKMARIGLEHGDKRLFTESLRGDSTSAAEARKYILNNDKLKKEIVEKFPSSEARCNPGRREELPFEKRVDEAVLDYLKDGRIALATITKNNTDDFTGMLDSPENVDLAVRKATEREKKEYQLGQRLDEGKASPKNGAEKQALEFYTRLKKAFVEGGGARRAAMWEDQLINGRESILSEMAKTHDWSGHSTRELMKKVEQLSKEDWELLKEPQGKEFREQIDKSLKHYTSDEERQRISRILDKKMAASTYEESQKIQRGIEDTINDSRKTLLGIGTGYDAAAIIRRLETMSQEEARKYKEDGQFRKQINELIDDNFTDAEKASAQRILKQVEATGQPATMELADKVLQSKVNSEKPEQTLRLAEELLKDPQARSRFSKPYSQLSNEDQALKAVVADAIRKMLERANPTGGSAAGLSRELTTNLFERGKLSLEEKSQLGITKKDLIADIAAAPNSERQRAMSRLGEDERKVAEAIASNPDKKPSLADRIRAFSLGLGGEYTDFKDALKDLSHEAKRSLKSEYAKKYGVNLENDFLGKVEDKDRTTYRDLLTPAQTDARQRFYENHAAMLRSDSGWSADGSKLTLERATTLYSTALEEYQKIYKTLPQEKQEALDKYFSESLQQFKDSKARLAEVLVDAVITATALAAAPITAGTSLALVASIAAGVGATARVATMAAIQGADFEATPENISKQLASGAANAALTFMPLGTAVRGKNLLRIAGENAFAGVVSNVTSDLVVAPFNKDGVNWDQLGQSALMGLAMGGTIPVAIKGLGKVVNVTKKPDGLHVDSNQATEAQRKSLADQFNSLEKIQRDRVKRYNTERSDDNTSNLDGQSNNKVNRSSENTLNLDDGSTANKPPSQGNQPSAPKKFKPEDLSRERHYGKEKVNFSSIENAVERNQLIRLVDSIFERFSPRKVTRTDMEEIIKSFPESDRKQVLALLERSAPNTSSVGLRERLKPLKELLKFHRAYTLSSDSSGNFVGYFYKKSTSGTLKMAGLDALEEDLKHGTLPQSIILFDDISTHTLTQKQKEILAKVPKVTFIDTGAFEKGVNLIDVAQGKEQIAGKLKRLLDEAKGISKKTGETDERALAKAVLDGSVDKAARELGPNVKVHTLKSRVDATPDRELDLKNIYDDMVRTKGSKAQIGEFLRILDPDDRELAAKLILNGVEYRSIGTMMDKSKQLSEQINKVLKSKGKSVSDLLIITDADPGGSAHMISYLFGKANNIPSKQFISTQQLNKMAADGQLKGKVVAYVDDTIYSGSQAIGFMTEMKEALDKADMGIIATLGAYEKGLRDAATTAKNLKLQNKVHITHVDRFEPILEKSHPFFKSLSKGEQADLVRITGENGYGGIKAANVWSHMVPDNDVELLRRFGEKALGLPGP